MTGRFDRVGLQSRAADAGAIALALLIGSLATDTANLSSSRLSTFNDVVGMATIAALWFRRRHPKVVAAVCFVGVALAPMAAGAAIVSVYTIAARSPRRVAMWVAAAYGLYLLAGAGSLALFGDGDTPRADGLLGGVAMTAAAVGWGGATRNRLAVVEALRERAERAELDRDAAVAEARRAERRRITSEMHDRLAHRLSLLSLQAGALELRPNAPADQRSEAARVVRVNAHLALDDLRTVIGNLREPADATEQLTPQPTYADIAALVAEAQAAGMSIHADTASIDPSRISDHVGQTVYNVVREGLTNARKHAPGQPVAIHLNPDERGVRIEIANPTTARCSTGDSLPTSGVGLIGLRERVESAGGTINHGIHPDGHFHLDVRLPATHRVNP